MIKVLFENYGQQIQFNVVDNKVFREAMEHPDEYKDLMVRFRVIVHCLHRCPRSARWM